jgi:hypothetical protein
MAIRVTCPSCKEVLTFADSFAGSELQCQFCAEMVQVGGSVAPKAAPPPEDDVPTLAEAPQPKPKPKVVAKQPAKPTPKSQVKREPSPAPAPDKPRPHVQKKSQPRSGTAGPGGDFAFDEGEDSDPIRRRRPPSSSGKWVALILGLLLAGGAAFGIVAYMNREKEKDDRVAKDGDKTTDKKPDDKKTDDRKPSNDKKPKDGKPEVPIVGDKKPGDKPPEDKLSPLMKASNPFGITPVVFKEDKKTVQMPSKIEDAVVAGGGRYLVLLMPEKNEIALFDVSAMKIVNQMQFKDGVPQIAAGLDKLILYVPGKSVQRYDLETLKLEATGEPPVNVSGPDPDGVNDMDLGCASRGPVAFSCGTNSPHTEIRFIDLNTLQRLPTRPFQQLPLRTSRVRASSNGRTFAVFRPFTLHGEEGAYRLNGPEVIGKRADGGRYLLPSADGRNYCSGHGMINSQFKRMQEQVAFPAPNLTIPAVHGDLYLMLGPPKEPKGENPDHAFLHVPGVPEPLAKLENLELPTTGNFHAARLTLDRKIIFVPAAEALITIPTGEDRLVFHRVDVIKLMQNTKTKHLFVNSIPPLRVELGKRMRYEVSVETKSNRVFYEIVKGPSEMDISPVGLITWKVPEVNNRGPLVDVVVRIREAEDRAILHAFRVAVGSGPEVGGILPAPDVGKPGEPIQPVLPPDTSGIVTTLPAPAKQVVVAGGGRTLLLHMPQKKALAVYDTVGSKLVKEIPLQSDEVVIAGGMSKFVLFLPKEKSVQRWDLKTLEKDMTAPFPALLPAEGIKAAMGSASQGPILVASSAANRRLTIYDLNTLKPLPIDTSRFKFAFSGAKGQVRASPTGDVFGMWNEGLSPSGIQICTLNGDRFDSHYLNESGGSVVPDVTGNRVCASQRGLLTNTGQYCDWNATGKPVLPSHTGRFFMAVVTPPADPTNPAPQRQSLEFCFDCGTNRIYTKEAVEGLEVPANPEATDLTLDQRIHYFHDLTKLVVISATGDWIVSHSFEPFEQLENERQDYVFITSKPKVGRLEKGDEFVYQIEVKTNKKDLKYQADLSPPGLTISPQGLVSWKVPENVRGPVVPVHLTVIGGGGHAKQTFRLEIGGVEAPPKPPQKSKLTVTSKAPVPALRGKIYTYPLVLTKAVGSVTFMIEKAPPGTAVSKQGLLTWTVPITHPVGNTEFIINLKDEAGQECQYSFSIPVR